jgi:hypothetical protein
MEDMTLIEFIESLKKLKLSEVVVFFEEIFINFNNIVEIISSLIPLLIIFWIIRHLWWFFSVAT